MEGKIKILSHDVNVSLEKPGLWSEGGMGRAFILEGKIAINSNMTLDAIKSTSIHEIVHYISDTLTLELSEQQIDGIATGIFTLLKDNPKYIKELFYK